MNKKEQHIRELTELLTSRESIDAGRLDRYLPVVAWAHAFLYNKKYAKHHGLIHGDSIRKSSIAIIEKLTKEENTDFMNAGIKMDPNNPFEASLRTTAISALLHDCGRINDKGNIQRSEQDLHHIIGAERGRNFCYMNNLETSAEEVYKAIEKHDFKSWKVTPHLKPPENIFGRIVQAIDQEIWFDTVTVARTMAFGDEMNRPFYKEDLTDEQRIKESQVSKDTPDTATILMLQYAGPRDSKRLGIKYVRDNVEKKLPILKDAIMQVAEQKGYKKEFKHLFELYEKERDRINY